MNILIITPSLFGGGAEKVVADLSLGLSANRDSAVYILTYEKKEKEYEYAGTRIDINCNGKGLINKIFYALKRISLCKKLVKKYNIDCILSFLPQCDYVNVLCKSKKTKSIINISSNMSKAYPRSLSRWLRKLVIKSADYTVCVSKGVLKDVIDNFGCSPLNSSVIYNPCDIEKIKEICREDIKYTELKDKLPEKYIVSMGSFRHAKGHWHLIKAFAAIKDRIPDISLVILGDGEYRGKYVELCQRLRIEDRVYLPGFVNPSYSVIAHSELFVLSSVYEGFCIAIIDAMVCGVPVLSTDCRFGPREILAPDTDFTKQATALEKCEYGCIIPAFDDSPIDVSDKIYELEENMGYSIFEMLNDRSLCDEYSKKACSYIEKLDNTHFVENWSSLIKEIIVP